MGDYKGKTDRQRIIDWLKVDLEYYKKNIGKTTEFKTVIDCRLVVGVENRIKQLERKEDAKNRRLSELT